MITKENLKTYIEELLDKIIVEELEQETQVYLKIILAGNNIIKYGIPVKLRQVSQIKKNKVADLKNLPLCHSHTHRNHLFSTATSFLKKPSILNAILGKYPRSSNMVNNGKKIAIGGNITDMTHVKV